jgi:hypothetical protein|tara:strand:- start:23 stop:193 length:171 start_codon:yes stop_codon:yes gene_type:complete
MSNLENNIIFKKVDEVLQRYPDINLYSEAGRKMLTKAIFKEISNNNGIPTNKQKHK